MLQTLVAGALLAGSALAAPAIEARQSTNIDGTVLNFALTLEHLENVFYKQALSNFSAAAFAAAGYDATYYNNLRYISYDEQSHVNFLTTALKAAGVTPVQQCTYNFPYTDVKSFITLSSILEGVGTSAYLGAAPLITDKGYLTAAGSILVTEALHTSYQRAAIKEVPMANPYGTPIDPMSAYSLAAMFIVNCPPGSPALPFTSFPALTYAGPAMKRSVLEARQGQGYSTMSGFPTNGFCYPTNYYAAQDQGQLNSNTGGSFVSQVQSRCEAACSANSQCKSFVGTIQVAADSPNLATSTCFFYNTASLTPRGCADHPYFMVAEVKGGSSSPAPMTTSAAAPATTATSATGAPAAPTSSASSPASGGGSSTAPTGPTAGSVVKFTTNFNIPAGTFVTFISGLAVESVAGTVSGMSITAAIPASSMGQTYVVLTNKNEMGKLNDTDVLAGPAIVEVVPPAPVLN